MGIDVKIGDLLTEEKTRLKPTEANSTGYKRVIKIDFSGQIHIGKKTTNTDMIVVKKGNLLISGINAEKGAVAVYSGDENVLATIHYSTYKFDENKIDIEYLKWFLKSNYFKKLLLVTAGGGIKTELKAKHLLPLRIYLPEISIQKSIVGKIQYRTELYNDIIEGIKEQSFFVDKLKTSILQDAIQGKLVQQDLTDEPATVLLERIKEKKQRLIDGGQLKKEKPLASIQNTETLFELPKGWEWCKLGDIVLGSQAGKSFTCQPRQAENNEWGVIKVSAISWGTFNEKENKALPDHTTPILEYKINIGDFLISRANTSELIGRSVIVNQISHNLLLSDKSIRMIFHDRVTKEYVNLFNSSAIARNYYKTVASGTSDSMKNITRMQMYFLPIALPPLNEQRRIVTKVNRLLSLCGKMEQQIVQSKIEADQLLEAVLQEAFEGNHTVPKGASKQVEVFWQKQLLASYINMLMEQHQEQGEMAIAKYTYLNDRVHDAGSGFRYVQHNFGPYSSEIKDCLTAPDAPFCKKTVGKKGYEVYHVNKELEAGFLDPENSSLQVAQNGFRQLMQVFSVFPMNERARQLEMIASICWLIEQQQSTDIDILYGSLENWPTPKREVQHKGQLFSKEEVAVGLQLIQQQGWHLKLLHQ